MDIDGARKMGAMALFGEKYGSDVRVVSVGDWAHELCGGTHAQRSGQIGVVSFLSEGSIGAGVRRIEAIVGVDAYRHLAREHVIIGRLAELVKVPADALPERVESLMTRLKESERELSKVRSATLAANVEGTLGLGQDFGPFRLWTFTAPEGTSANDLRDLLVKARGNARPDMGVIMVGAAIAEGRVALTVGINPHAQSLGLSASALLQTMLPSVEGRGGGKDDMAQGGGTRVEGIDEGFEAVRALVAGKAAGA